jgi:LysM repeat protein
MVASKPREVTVLSVGQVAVIISPMTIVYRFLYFSILSIATFMLSSCAGFEPTLVDATGSPTPNLGITPYWTPTTSPSPKSFTPVPTLTATLMPSPTPFTHTIVKGDMLGSIAFQYGLTVEDLIAANPEVDPGFLTIGSTIVVPLEEGDQLIEATPVPLPIQLDEPECYPTSDGGAFCVMLATNSGEIGVENISAKIGFISSDGDGQVEEVALSPLNVLPAGESLPVLAFFSTPPDSGVDIQGELISALPLLDENTRYLNAEVELEEFFIEPDGNQATVQGQVNVPAGSEPPDYIWLAAVAYEESGEVVGVRKWEASADDSCPDLDKGAQADGSGSKLKCLSFELAVFSLGPDIERVEVHVEAGYQTELEETP